MGGDEDEIVRFTAPYRDLYNLEPLRVRYIIARISIFTSKSRTSVPVYKRVAMSLLSPPSKRLCEEDISDTRPRLA